MRARISNVYQALVWACYLSSLASASDPMNSTVWRQLTSDLVVTSSAAAGGYLGSKRARSRVECVLVCNRHPDCVSVIFGPTSGDCYLQADLSNDQTQPAHLGQVWAKKDATCHTNDASILNGIVEWDHTLTSPKQTVTCNEEFMKTTDDVTVTCMAGGSWQSEGQCVRHIWTNPPLSSFPLSVPIPVIDGWTMCVEGFPTKATTFSVNLWVDLQNMALHADFRQNWGGLINILLTNIKLNDVWGGSGDSEVRTTIDPFPVSVDTPFRIKVKATSSNTFEVYPRQGPDGILSRNYDSQWIWNQRSTDGIISRNYVSQWIWNQRSTDGIIARNYDSQWIWNQRSTDDILSRNYDSQWIWNQRSTDGILSRNYDSQWIWNQRSTDGILFRNYDSQWIWNQRSTGGSMLVLATLKAAKSRALPINRSTSSRFERL